MKPRFFLKFSAAAFLLPTLCPYPKGLAQKAQVPDTVKKWIVFHHGNSPLPDKPVTAIAVDGQGTAWLGCSGKLLRVEPPVSGNNDYSMHTCKKPFALKNPGDITTIAIDRYQNKWVGFLSGGLAKFDNTTWVYYNKKKSCLPENMITVVVIDDNDTKWIGTQNSGLVRMNDTSCTVFNKDNSGLPSNHVRALAAGKNGWIWVAAEGKLVKFNGDTTWVFCGSGPSSFPCTTINTLAPDNKANIWMGCGGSHSRNDGGVVIFSDRTLQTFTNENAGLPSNHITSIAAADSGVIWTAARNVQFTDATTNTETLFNGGFASFDGAKWTNHTSVLSQFLKTGYLVVHAGQYSGLLSQQQLINRCLDINAIAPDPLEKIIWLGTDNGLFLYFLNGINVK